MNQSTPEVKSQINTLLDKAYASRMSDLKQSTALAKQALGLSQSINDISLQAKSLSHLSLFYMICGEYEQSLQMGAQALEYFEGLNDEQGIANAKYNIAGVHYKTDNYHLGMVNLLDCITTFKKYNDYYNLSRAHKSLGTIYEYFGDEKNAIKTYEDSIAAAKKAGDLNLKSNAYNTLSGIYLKQKNIAKAFQLISESIIIKKKTGDTRGLAFGYYGRGKVYLVQKRYEEAAVDLKKAVEMHLKMGETLGLGMAYHKLAVLYVETGQLDEAKALLKRCLNFSTDYNLIMVKFKCYYLYYQLYKLENDPENSLKYLELYLKEKESVINTQTLMVIENYAFLTKMESLKKEAQLKVEKAEIIKKKNHAEQVAVVKQEFLSTMSHEIRTPLNAVITIAGLLGDRTDKAEQELVNALRFASNNLLLIINDILDFTKLDADKARLDLWPVDFKLLLDNIKNTYHSLANEKGLRLTLQIDEGVADCYEIDETKMSQILGNLLTNAIKFTQSGHIDIVIKKTASHDQDDELLFTVKDTGMGIADDYKEHIFDSFSQPKSITTKKQGGSGLGLAIVKKLVALHGGSIQVDSVIGSGSSFYFTIKLKRATIANKQAQSYNNSLEGKTVLLAEDNMINAMVLGKLLANWKMTTHHAKNGFEVVEAAKQKRFDFILMDIHMPDMDGFEATKLIIASENPNSKTPIFALTADVTAEYQKEHHIYFKGFLRKPIEVDKLYNSMNNSLQESI
ncbi:MAG: ATP-binding protein [Mucilaginibacter sp.]